MVRSHYNKFSHWINSLFMINQINKLKACETRAINIKQWIYNECYRFLRKFFKTHSDTIK